MNSNLTTLAQLSRCYPQHGEELAILRASHKNGIDVTNDIAKFKAKHKLLNRLRPYTTYVTPELPQRIAVAAKAAGKPKYQYLMDLLNMVVP